MQMLQHFFKSKKIYSFYVFLLLVFSVELLVANEVVNPIFLPAPSDVLKNFISLVQDHTIWSDVQSSLRRVIISIIFVIGIGTPLGFLLYRFSWLRSTLDPFFDFLRSIPPIVFYPLFMFAVGLGDPSRIATATWGCVLMYTLQVTEAFTRVSQLKLRIFKRNGLSRFFILKNIILRESASDVIIALRQNISFAFIIIIVTEMLVGDRFGLGSRINQSQIIFDTETIYSIIIIIGIISYTINTALKYWATTLSTKTRE